jgi:hypothetical protein
MARGIGQYFVAYRVTALAPPMRPPVPRHQSFLPRSGHFGPRVRSATEVPDGSHQPV